MLLKFVYSHTSLLILFIFDLKRENIARMVRDINSMKHVTMNETRLKQNKICNNLSHTEQRKSCPNSMILKRNETKGLTNKTGLEWSNFPKKFESRSCLVVIPNVILLNVAAPCQGL